MNDSTDPTPTFYPPSPLPSDYIEIAYLTAFFLLGAPLNLAAYADLRDKEPYGIIRRIHLLKQHLNYTDLLVLMIYIPSKVCWLVTYSWRGGVALCKVTKALHNICFQASSNVIVCIALERLMSVLRPAGCCRKASKKMVPMMLAGAWLTAVILSIPQMFIWTVVEPFPKWQQCATRWTAHRWLQKNETRERPMEEQMFLGLHLLFVFWLPLLVIGVSYVVVACWVARHSRAMKMSEQERSVRILLVPTAKLSSIDIPQIQVTDCDRNPQANGLSMTETQQLSFSEKSRLCDSQSSRKYRTPSQQTRWAKSRTIQISCMLVGIYVICWLPYQSLSVWRFVDQGHYYHIFGSSWDFLHGLVVLNSVINPFFYGMFANSCRK